MWSLLSGIVSKMRLEKFCLHLHLNISLCLSLSLNIRISLAVIAHSGGGL